MSEPLKIGMRVELTGKGIQGSIAFVGKTQFASGDWIGVILDEPKGKNNGSLRGVQYFKVVKLPHETNLPILLNRF